MLKKKKISLEKNLADSEFAIIYLSCRDKYLPNHCPKTKM